MATKCVAILELKLKGGAKRARINLEPEFTKKVLQAVWGPLVLQAVLGPLSQAVCMGPLLLQAV